ncbi:hypothetical protein FGRMN_6452 [Fusarium graminum]|nr:hypothetical protein FGRMN_6452 [Fusarium graminum]
MFLSPSDLAAVILSAAREWAGLSLLVLSVIVSQANALVFSVANSSRDATRTDDALATITSAPGIAQPFEVNTCSYYNATESRTLWNNPWCSMYVGTVDLVFWPTIGNHSYPSTYRDTVSDYTFTSPSVYMIINTMYAENPCGPLGPSAGREIFAFDLTEVSTLVPYADDTASMQRATRQLYLSDLDTHCTRSFNRTELATQKRPTKDDDSRCNPFLTVPKKFKEYGYPYWLHCGIRNNKFGVFDPPYAIPALDELIPAHTTSVQDHDSKNPTTAPSAPGKAPTNAGSIETAVSSLHNPEPTLARSSGHDPTPAVPVNTKSAPGNPSGAGPFPTIPSSVEPAPAGPDHTEPSPNNNDSKPAPANPGTTNPSPAGLGNSGPAPAMPGNTKPDPTVPEGADTSPAGPGTVNLAPANPVTSNDSPDELGHSMPISVGPGSTSPAPIQENDTKPAPVIPGYIEPVPGVPGGTDPTPANSDNAVNSPADAGNTDPAPDSPDSNNRPSGIGNADHIPSSPGDVKPAPAKQNNPGDPASAIQGHAGASNSLKGSQATAANSGNAEPSDPQGVADPAHTGASDGLGVPETIAGGSADAEPTVISQANDGTDDELSGSKDGHRRISYGESLPSVVETSEAQEYVMNQMTKADPTAIPDGVTSTASTQVMSLGTAGLEVINKDNGETSTYAVPVAGASQPDGGLIPASVAVYSGHTVTQEGPALTVTNAIVVSLYPESSTGTSESSIATGGSASSATISAVPDSPASHFTPWAYSFVLYILAYGWMHL